jgi:transitional endoplasmic reticulum ATPase
MGSPSILFIDELESLVGNRSIGKESTTFVKYLESSSGGVQERVLATLLNEMDGVEALNDVLIVAATNRIDMIDNAVLRPGRIDIQLHIPTPDFYSRQEILKLYMEGVPVDSDVDLNAVAAKVK